MGLNTVRAVPRVALVSSAVIIAAATLAGCATDSATTASSIISSASTAATAAGSATSSLPTAEDLNAVLKKATDPAVPVEEKVTTVQGGEAVPEIFPLMTQSQQESGANFTVVPPVLPGYAPDSVLTTVSFTLPGMAPQAADNVEFVNEAGTWKLSQQWACTLVENTVTPEQVPAMCRA
ncbi:MAG: hypothetical protein SPI77_03265 [Corynebacterium sp.]|nr:hypothetical protein [Corynebacterium sp.]